MEERHEQERQPPTLDPLGADTLIRLLAPNQQSSIFKLKALMRGLHASNNKKVTSRKELFSNL